MLPGSSAIPGPEAGCAADVRRQQAQQRAKSTGAEKGAPQVPGAPLGQAAATSESKNLQPGTRRLFVAVAGSLPRPLQIHSLAMRLPHYLCC